MSPALRTFLIWALGILLLVYIAGTFRLALPLVAGHGTQGAPLSSILGGFYLRLVVMGFIFYFFIRLRRGRKAGK